MFSGKHLSKFDPHHRGLSRLQKALQRFFPERQLIVRSGERMRTLRLSTNRQAVLAGLAAVVGCWTLLSSGLVMSYTERIRTKNIEIKDSRIGYELLLAQATIYKERIADLAQDLAANYTYSLALVEKESDILRDRVSALEGRSSKSLVAKLKSRAKEALTGDKATTDLALGTTKLDRRHEEVRRKELMGELAELQDSMVDVVGHHKKMPFIASDGLELRQVVLERDLAMNDRNTLSQKVVALEDQIREMEVNELLLYHRFSEIADMKIASIEDSLSAIGLDVDLPLRKKKGNRGAGGPFYPVKAMPENAGPIQESFNGLDARIDWLTNLKSLLVRLPIAKPMQRFSVNSGFGVRKDPFTGLIAQHLGLDLGGSHNASILSTGEGKIVRAGWNGSYGRMVLVDHGMGLTTRFGHLHRIAVKKGDTVTRGATLGRMGCTGRCSGPHLHYEILVNGKPVNPWKFLKAGKDVLTTKQ